MVDRSLEDGAGHPVLISHRAATALIPALPSEEIPMTLALSKSPPPRLTRAIVRRTRGRRHGAITRLMSPSDFGEILKPFVFLDLFDHEGPPFNGPLHPQVRRSIT